MRKDTKKKENAINLIIVLLLLVSSMGGLQLLYFNKIREQSNIINMETKTTKLEQYYLSMGKNIEGKNFNNVSAEETITEVYKKNQSFEVGNFSEKDSVNNIQKDPAFMENKNFSKKKLLTFAKKIGTDINITVNIQDLVKYNQDELRKQSLNSLINFYLANSNCNKTFKNSIQYNKRKIIKGYKIILPMENIEDKNFTKEEIKKFIFEEKLKKNIHYTMPEKRSGYIITVKLTGCSKVIIDAVEYFLKHKEFNEEKLKKFLLVYGVKTKNFLTLTESEYKNSLEESNNINVNSEVYKNIDLDKYVHIKIFSNVTLNEETKLLFKKEFNKKFVLTGHEYSKVNVTETIKSKDVTITDEFHKNFLLPSMEARYINDMQFNNCYNKVISHNSGHINLLMENYQKQIITIDDTNREYLYICYGQKNDGVILQDAHSNPFIFIITEISFINNENYQIDESQFNNYIDNVFNGFVTQGLFLMIFNIAYDKLKTSVAA